MFAFLFLLTSSSPSLLRPVRCLCPGLLHLVMRSSVIFYLLFFLVAAAGKPAFSSVFRCGFFSVVRVPTKTCGGQISYGEVGGARLPIRIYILYLVCANGARTPSSVLFWKIPQRTHCSSNLSGRRSSRSILAFSSVIRLLSPCIFPSSFLHGFAS